MEGAEALCDKRGIGKVRAECVQRVARRSDGLTVKWLVTEAVMPSRSQTQLLSGLAAAGTVRRLWTGAEAKNVNLIIMQGHARGTEQDLGTERTNGCTGGKAWLLSATLF